jgi:alpha-L-rhamnosidase
MIARGTIRNGMLGGIASLCLFGGEVLAQSNKPVKLECESLITPLGMDVAKPILSWKLQDDSAGAQQTAYEVQVASNTALLATGRPDIWDSKRVESGNSIGAVYQGPPLAPSKRYFWRVLVWDREGKPYPPSDVSWWETGLLGQENWKAKWIGYEEPEHKRVRESAAKWITNADTKAPNDSDKTSHDFRLHFEVTKPIRRASLYVTGQDTTSAWVNGKQILA